ncbi:MAG: serine hydrolase domain-containing protein [Bacteroidota bacterium]
MKNLLFPFLACFLITACNPTTPPATEPEVETTNPVADSLTAELDTFYQQGHITGLAVAVVSEDEVLYTNGFGYADLHMQKPYTENTVQNIASISKTLIGIALVKAQELGKLQLDDPINDYLPYEVVNPHFPEDVITIRHLTTHTSSIIDTELYDGESYILHSRQHDKADREQVVPEEFKPNDEDLPMAEFLQNFLDQEGEWYAQENFLEKRPGAFFEYTNIGATLAAQVLEYATGTNFADFTRQHILLPLGMESSGWSFDKIDFNQHSTLYSDSIAELPFYYLVTYPDGGFRTSSANFALYLQELIRGYAGKGTILSPEGYEAFYTQQMNDSQFEERDAEWTYNDEYDFGVFIGFAAETYIGHTGGDPGVASFMFFDKEKKIGRFLMINTDLNSQEGVDEFFGIWEKLKEYEDRL